MSFFRPGLPRDLSVITRFHRHVPVPDLGSLDDFEEIFLFRSEHEKESADSTATTFWLIHEHDDCLWMLSMVPGIGTAESIVAWCKAPNDARKEHVAEQLVFEWCRACIRHEHDSRIRSVHNTGELSLDLRSVFDAAVKHEDTPLHEAAWYDDVPFAVLLLDGEASIDQRDQDGRTPLHYAALQGSMALTRLLLERGSNAKTHDKDGMTALDIAKANSRAAMVTLLEADTGPEDSGHDGEEDQKRSHSGSSTSTTPTSVASRSLSPTDLVLQLLNRAARWRRRDEYLAARHLLERAAKTKDAPPMLVARAIASLIHCEFALGKISTIDQGLEQTSNDTTLSAEARAEVLLRRGVFCLKRDDPESARRWFARILELEDAAADTVAKARLQLAAGYDRQGQTERALNELNGVLSSQNLSNVNRSRALLRQGMIKYTEGQTQAAIEDYSRIVDTCSSRPGLQAKALIERSKCYEELKRPADVVRDLASAVELGGCDRGSAAASLHNYGVRCNLRGEPDKAYDYFSAVPKFGGASVWIMTNAQVNRGCYLGEKRELGAAVTEFKLARSTPEIPDDVFARAVYNLGNARRLQGNYRAAIRHFSRVIESQNPPDPTLASALARRGICWSKLDKPEKGIRDLTRALDIPDADTDTVADALLWSAICCHEMEDTDGAAEHFGRLIELSAASVEMRARAKWGLGDVLVETGDRDRGCKLLLEARQELAAIGREDLVSILNQGLEKHGYNSSSAGETNDE